MSFFLLCIIAIIALGAVAAVASWGDTDAPIVEGEDCATCSSKADGSCKIACLMEEKKRREGSSDKEKKVHEGNKQAPKCVK